MLVLDPTAGHVALRPGRVAAYVGHRVRWRPLTACLPILPWSPPCPSLFVCQLLPCLALDLVFLATLVAT